MRRGRKRRPRETDRPRRKDPLPVPPILSFHMTQARIIDGRAVAQAVREEVREEVSTWIAQGRPAPRLAVVLVGNHPASASYVRGKRKASAEAGVESETLRREENISEEALLDLVHTLNADQEIDGILVQLPLPGHISEKRIIHAIDPAKDVDGFHPENVGRLLIGDPAFVSATPAGIMELLSRAGIALRGQRAVVVGRSNIVGKPLAALLMQRGTDATVTVCHSRTQRIEEITREADILVAAIGRAGFVTRNMVKPGAAVIDVGINRVEEPTRARGYRLAGDVDFDDVLEQAGHITPVPGGVGPMTIAMLLRNTLAAAKGAYR